MKKPRIIVSAVVLSVFAASYCPAQEMSDAEIISAIKEHPYRAAGGHSPYYAPDVKYTPAPKGYKPVYVSHIGRHGSRYQIRFEGIYDPVIAAFDSLHSIRGLTPQGDSLRAELRHIRAAHVGMDGMLTERGAGEHNAIARRLAARCPEVFRQKGSKTVSCTATTVQRTIQSMAGFVSGLSSANPGLDFQIGCGFPRPSFYRPEDKEPLAAEAKDILKATQDALFPSADELKDLNARLFKTCVANPDFLCSLMVACSAAGCLDIDVNPLRFFTAEELFKIFKYRDVNFCRSYGAFAPTFEHNAKKSKEWLRLIVDEADAALDGNGHCADLRFAHDGNLGPLMALLGIGGYATKAQPEAPYRTWQGFNYMCMASNLQLEFYRKAKSDVVLVKALYNEKEVGFPGLEPINGVYYKWSDVRRYMVCRCEKIMEVPEYYDSYLKEKADKIHQLQQDEMDGFYFITDMHFPSNYGYAAALMESLQNSTSKRLIFYGGDGLTYVNDMNEPMAMQISALEQMRGTSPVFWARGNHDVVNYTGVKEWINTERKTLPAWDSKDVLGRFRPSSAVCNESDPYTAYCYYDNLRKKVRYVVFDSSDKVQDDNKQEGISATQMKWIIEKAILEAPKGYKLMFFSHIPFIGEHTAPHLLAADVLSAFGQHSSVELNGKVYDFSSRPDLQMVGVMCGHRHRDFVKRFPSGQYQVNTAADCSYQRLTQGGTLDEQCFDYVSISKDGRTIRTVRIGAGKDREFNCDAPAEK